MAYLQRSRPQRSGQGEHIFNAVGDLIRELEGYLSAVNAARGDLGNLFNFNINAFTAAQQALNTTARLGQEAIAARDNAEFRTADRGDPTNAGRYSSFADRTRAAVRQIAAGNPSEQTRGYTELNRLLASMENFTIDESARRAERDSLSAGRQGVFDNWFEDTKARMYNAYRQLRDAAVAVGRAGAGVYAQPQFRPEANPLNPIAGSPHTELQTSSGKAK